MSVRSSKNNISLLLLPIFEVALIVIFDIYFCGIGDFLKVFRFALALFLLGLSFLPVSIILFNRFHDNGWLFSKTIALAFDAWLLYSLSTFKLVKFTLASSLAICFIGFLLSVGVFYLYQKKAAVHIDIKQAFSFNKIVAMVNVEAIFFCVLCIWSYIKGFNPSAYGTEKFMDYAYITAILKSDYMPAKDPWFSGTYINYYYIGQYISAFLVRISGVGPGYGYNLMMMTLAAFGFALPYSIVNNLFIFKEKMENREIKNSKSWIAATLAGFSVSIAGNMHFPIYKWFVPFINKAKNNGVETSYWFADPTRYIGYNPDVPDKTIHEYPSYSFVLGDLHAHVINIMFVLTVVALLLSWLMYRKPLMDISKNSKEGAKFDAKTIVKEVFAPQMIGCMFFIGLFHMTNYWDFPIYFVISAAVILISNLLLYSFTYKGLILSLIQYVAFFVIWEIVSFPFSKYFDNISTSIKLCETHTPLYQLLVLWGLPSILILLFVVFVTLKNTNNDLHNFIYIWGIPALIVDAVITAIQIKEKNNNYLIGVVIFIALLLIFIVAVRAVNAREKKAIIVPRDIPVTELFRNVSATDMFICILGLCALGLIILPEVIYVVDIYSGAYKRANTMFKLVYQGFILFGICMPYIILSFVDKKNHAAKRIVGIIGFLCLCMTVCYFGEAYNAWFANRDHKSLDASAFVYDENKDDAAAVEFINKEIDHNAVILEMCGLSYTYFNRISVLTGNETVLGWQTHEWLWRSSGTLAYPEEVSGRHTDVVNVYTGTNVDDVVELIKKYNIDYIYVGEAELLDGYASLDSSNNQAQYFHGGYYKKIKTNHELLRGLGDIVFEIPANAEKAYSTYIVKVDLDNIKVSGSILPPGTAGMVDNSPKPHTTVKTNVDTGEIIEKINYEYDDYGYKSKQIVYDGEGALTGSTEYYYNECVPNYCQELDADGNRISFWNFIEFQGDTLCTLKHCFANDEKWLFSVKSGYSTDGKLLQETYEYPEGKGNYTISYVYDGDLLTNSWKQIDGVTTKTEYLYEGDMIKGEDIYEGDNLKYHVAYIYN